VILFKQYNTLPYAGGIQDQPFSFVKLLYRDLSIQNEVEGKDYIKKKREQTRKGRKRGRR